jgi:hypothetical protein
VVTWHRTHVCFTINLLTHVRTHPERARGGGDTPSRGFPRMAGLHLRATKPAGTPRPVAHLLLTQPRQSRVPNTPSSPLTCSPLTYKVAGISIMSGVCGVGLAQRCSAPWSGAQGCSSTGYPPARLGGLLGLLSFPSLVSSPQCSLSPVFGYSPVFQGCARSFPSQERRCHQV